MSTIDRDASLARLVLDEPRRGELFERLGLDYCCRGERSLVAACAEQGVDLEAAAAVLEAHEHSRRSGPEHDFDPAAESTAALCDHVVAIHHERLRHELPRINETLTTVVRVHGGDDPRLGALAQIFDDLTRELLLHLDREEELLFPAALALEAGGAPVDRQALLEELEHDHADVGEALRVIRDLTGGYDPAQARCGTHRSLLEGLHALERDLHQHVHEENNVLFPRIRSRLAA